jgi:hypothetical protein
LANQWREILTQITTFLAGISFASLLLILQFKESIPSSTIQYLTGSLAFSAVFFLFSAIFCLINPQKTTSQRFHVFLYFSGFLFFFLSLYLLLSLIDQTVAIISSILAFALFVAYIIVALTD